MSACDSKHLRPQLLQNLDNNLSYIATTGGTATYATPEGLIGNKGMSVLNPKRWLTNTARAGLFFKLEFAYQAHYSARMRSYAWRTGLGKEVSLTFKGLVQERFTLLGIASYAFPGAGLKSAFAEEPVPNWFTAQLAVFVNF